MSFDNPRSDAELLDVIRMAGGLTVEQMVSAMQTTATAVRQRLVRLTYKGMLSREPVRHGKQGRPSHIYRLSEATAQQPAISSHYHDAVVVFGSIVGRNGQISSEVWRARSHEIIQALSGAKLEPIAT